MSAAGAPSAPPQPPVRMAIVGDSLALGTGATDSSRGFGFLLFRRVLAARPASTMTNFAIGGTTAADVLRLEVPRIAAARPDVILVAVGGNDVIRGTDEGRFAAAYRDLADALRRAAPGARIVFFNIPDASVSPIFDASVKPAMRRIEAADNRAIAATARRAGAPLFDLYALSHKTLAANTARFLSPDRFHPSDEGYAAIAHAAWPAVEAATAPPAPK